MNHRRIALIGTAASGADGPYKDTTYEIWGVASRLSYVTRADRWFELHRLDGESPSFQAHWRRDVKKFSADVELIMLYPEPDLGPNVTAYPFQRMVDRFGTYFMTSSFSWMFALAIDEMRPWSEMARWHERTGLDEIGIWGVDMEYGTEYRQQRAGFRHFVDVAHGLGIKVTRFVDTGLSYDPIPYPLWQDDPLLNKLEQRASENSEKLDASEENLKRTHTMIAQNKMAIQELSSPMLKKERLARVAFLEKELKALMETSGQISHDIVHCCAVEAELKYWRDYLSP